MKFYVAIEKWVDIFMLPWKYFQNKFNEQAENCYVSYYYLKRENKNIRSILRNQKEELLVEKTSLGYIETPSHKSYPPKTETMTKELP